MTQEISSFDAVDLFNRGNTEGMLHNFPEAFECFRKASEQGYAPALTNLGFFYEKGLGVPHNFLKAVECYKKAAEQGYAPAQCNLGWCYESGNGVKQNLTTAIEYYVKAADQ